MRTERGATMIEGALITPVIFLMILGLIEGGFMFRTHLSANNAAVAGVRAGSIAASDETADHTILDSVNTNSAAVGKRNLKYVIVYKAASRSDEPPASCVQLAESTDPHGVNDLCNVFPASDLTRNADDFGTGGFGGDQYWAPTTRLHSQNGGSDLLGVYVKMDCNCMVTKLFGISPRFSSKSVARLEVDRL